VYLIFAKLVRTERNGDIIAELVMEGALAIIRATEIFVFYVEVLAYVFTEGTNIIVWNVKEESSVPMGRQTVTVSDVFLIESESFVSTVILEHQLARRRCEVTFILLFRKA